MSNPRQFRSCCCVVSREDALRLDAYVMRVGGLKHAPRLLGMGESTVVAGMEEGRMLTKTRDRLFAALDREEARQ
jgi:hypothetical protein